MNSLETMEIKDTAKEMMQVVDKSSPDNFLFKARTYEETLSWKAAQNLILTIAVMSESFPKGGSFFAFWYGWCSSSSCHFYL